MIKENGYYIMRIRAENCPKEAIMAAEYIVHESDRLQVVKTCHPVDYSVIYCLFRKSDPGKLLKLIGEANDLPKPTFIQKIIKRIVG